MSAIEKFECGCVGIRVAPRTMAKLKLCIQHRSDPNNHFPTFLLRNVPEAKGTPLSLNSKEWQEIESDLLMLLYHGEQYRELQRHLRSLLTPSVQS